MEKGTNARDKPETVQSIPLSEIRAFPNHPFLVRDDDLMQDTVDSIQKVGILNPVIVRPVPEGGYEMISGHRRMHAADLIGMKELPAIIRDMTDDEAVIFMVDSNLQREEILPSERAMAYKMKLEALKHQGARTDLTSTQVVSKLRSNEAIGGERGESRETVRRYIRLTELDPQLQQMVDEKKIGITPAVELSYLKPDEQTLLLDTIDSEQATPSLSQAQRMKKLSGEGKLTDDSMLAMQKRKRRTA